MIESQITPGATSARLRSIPKRERRKNREKKAKEATRGDDLTGRSLDGEVLLGDEGSLSRSTCHRVLGSKIDHVLLDLI